MNSSTLLDRLRHPWGQALLVAVAYALSVWCGLRLLAGNSIVAIIWPASGVLVGALLVWRETPRHYLAGAAVGAAVAVHVGVGIPIVPAVLQSALGVGECVLIAWLLLRWHDDVRRLTSVPAIFALCAVAAGVAAAFGLVHAVIVLLSGGAAGAGVRQLWGPLAWGHTLGVLLFTPPWLAWSGSPRARRSPRSTARRLEAALAGAALLTVTTLVFFHGVGGFGPLRFLSLPYQTLPVALWIAIRFGTRGTSLAMAAVAMLAVIGTSLDGGAFRLTHPDPADRVLLAQGYVVSLTLGCMALAIAIEQAHGQERQTRLLNESLAEANAVLTHEIGERERTALSLRMLLDATPEGILVVDVDGRIVEVNTALERMVGYTRLQLLGQSSEALVGQEHRAAAAAYIGRFAAAGDLDATRTNHDLLAVRNDGSHFEAQVSLNPYHLGDQLRIIATVRDVTAVRAVERRMETSLREKEVLLREVHHRVKNNMAVMSSLFYLQSRHATDPHTVRVFRESESRVRSMAMVHEVLYRSGDLSALDFGHYLESLVDHLGNMYRGTLPTLRVERDIQPIRLSIEQAVPCGLLLNEVLTNALKHAFVDGEPALLRVDARSRSGEVHIDIVDNGVGMPDDVSPASTQTLGVRLMQALIEQLDGSITHTRQPRGTHTRVSFPLVVGTSSLATMPVATSA